MANLNGHKTHRVVDKDSPCFENMEHRGACGCEPETGDVAGILVQTPHIFFKNEALKLIFIFRNLVNMESSCVLCQKTMAYSIKFMTQMESLIHESNFHIWVNANSGRKSWIG